jgi:hypothetical protein
VFWQSAARAGDGGRRLAERDQRQARIFSECIASLEQGALRSACGTQQNLSAAKVHQADGGSCAAPWAGVAFSFATGAAFGPPFDTPTSAGRSTRSAIM